MWRFGIAGRRRRRCELLLRARDGNPVRLVQGLAARDFGREWPPADEAGR